MPCPSPCLSSVCAFFVPPWHTGCAVLGDSGRPAQLLGNVLSHRILEGYKVPILRVVMVKPAAPRDPSTLSWADFIPLICLPHRRGGFVCFYSRDDVPTPAWPTALGPWKASCPGQAPDPFHPQSSHPRTSRSSGNWVASIFRMYRKQTLPIMLWAVALVSGEGALWP